MRRIPFAVLALLVVIHAAPASARGSPGMVAAANPLAAAAGMKVLKAGGSAVDAAVAIQATLGLVEPQSSGLGGGGFMVFYDAKTGKVTAYDGRETASAGATPDMFLTPDGRPMPFFEAILSGRSTGVPGAVAMLALVQSEHGTLPWRRLFDSSRQLALKGFVVSPRLADYIVGDAPQATAPDVVAYFTKPGGGKYAAGDVLKNPAYAHALQRLADEGPSALYRGSIAADIAARVQRDPGGTLTTQDIAAYKPQESPALCRPYRVYLVCVPPPPSGGAVLLEALGILERTDINTRGPDDAKGWFELAQAHRIAYADRNRYMGDPAFVSVPVEGLLSSGYLNERAALVGETAGPPPEAGVPPGAPAAGADTTREPGGTSHFVVIDRAGNVVSMTTTVESVFGSGRMVDGYILNNQLTDFAFAPVDAQGRPAANAVAPGKRPRSTMSPTIVLDRQGHFVAALGSPGGGAIVAYNLKALVGVLDWHLSMQQAISLPNLIAVGPINGAEVDKFPAAVVQGLAERGVTLAPGQGEGSGLHGVMIRNGKLEGGADPRREGVVLSH